MISYCHVLGCTDRSDWEKKHLEYYRLTKVKEKSAKTCLRNKRRLWLAKLNQDFQGRNLDNIRVCSYHFRSGR
ncbi:THAP domain-containing protein 11 [Labeo rohita]|uniref:THAP domain-containing protein 11 n=1 Tax=Labeo rohita TaxID=84645 RepID=A0ABQ8MW10_LABRO|nr:THAP domain-containing protein 11 [Labeo rohita]